MQRSAMTHSTGTPVGIAQIGADQFADPPRQAHGLRFEGFAHAAQPPVNGGAQSNFRKIIKKRVVHGFLLFGEG